MIEALLLAQVVRLCEQRALLWHHCDAAYRCTGPRGFPDTFIAGPRGHLIAEIKHHRGEQLGRGQTDWRWMLTAAGLAYVIWTGEDLGSGLIAAQLDAIAK